jgi:hypothetical protein
MLNPYLFEEQIVIFEPEELTVERVIQAMFSGGCLDIDWVCQDLSPNFN